jgi:hypothetical protein
MEADAAPPAVNSSDVRDATAAMESASGASNSPAAQQDAEFKKSPFPSPKTSSTWVVFHDEQTKSKKRTDSSDFLATVTAAGTCTDLQGFTRLYQQTQKTAVGKSVRVNFRVFREDIQPMWEDLQNINGGECVFTFTKKQDASRIIHDMMKAMFSNKISEGRNINGIVLSTRRWGHLLNVWLRYEPRNGDLMKRELCSHLRFHSPKFITFQSAREILSKTEERRANGQDSESDYTPSCTPDVSPACTPDSTMSTISLISDVRLGSPRSDGSTNSGESVSSGNLQPPATSQARAAPAKTRSKSPKKSAAGANKSPSAARSPCNLLRPRSSSSEAAGLGAQLGELSPVIEEKQPTARQPKGPDGTKGFATIHSMHRRSVLAEKDGSQGSRKNKQVKRPPELSTELVTHSPPGANTC